LNSSFRFNAGIGRIELVVLILVFACLSTIVVPIFLEKKKGAELSVASVNLQTLYQNQVLQYFSSKRFLYSLTRIQSWPDFIAVKPPSGVPEKLVGLDSGDREQVKKLGYRYVPWKEIGFPLRNPSFFLYRVGPENSYSNIAKPGRSHGNPYHFQVVAVADLDADSKPSIMLRSGYVDRNDLFHGMESIYSVDLME
jgi:hypothetical protein